jgi:molybdate transport system ATP-binding protein
VSLDALGLDATVRLRLGALDLDAHVGVAAGEVVAVLGPNGAGKTTLLRVLAGLVAPASGRVVLDGSILDDPAAGVWVPPERRPVGVVFQDGLLFPHLSALDNVAFGLRCRGLTRSEARVRARDQLEQAGLGDLAARRPVALSGGQTQRVALARALVIEPRLLLLDEPLSALDAGARVEVRRALRRELATFEGTRLLVTHDPLDAVALADRLVVLEQGRVVQSGPIADVTARPRSRYVADLVGTNLMRGTARGDRVVLADGSGEISVPGAGAGDVFVLVHPRAVALHRRRPEGTPRNVWRGRAEALEPLGDRVRVRVLASGERAAESRALVAEITPAAVIDLGLADGVEVWASVKATEVSVYPA